MRRFALGIAVMVAAAVAPAAANGPSAPPAVTATQALDRLKAGNERFVNMADAYDPLLRQQAQAAAAAVGLTLHEGVYAWVLGPQFETPAEIRMLQRLGARAVGMSTVPETILCRHAGIKVLGLSMMTNMGCGMEDEVLSHAHTLNTAGQAAQSATRALQAIMPALSI